MKKATVNTWKHRRVQAVHILLSVMVISVLFTHCGAQFFANIDGMGLNSVDLYVFFKNYQYSRVIKEK